MKAPGVFRTLFVYESIGEIRMIRALFFDLDGTLLNGQKELSGRTVSALSACKKRGIRLFVATARPPILDRMLGWTAEEMGLFDGGVYCNGGCEVIDGCTCYHFIPEEVVNACTERVNRADKVNIALQMGGARHAFNHPLADFAYPRWGITRADVVPLDHTCAAQTVKLLIYHENIIDTVTPLSEALVRDLRACCDAGAQFYLTDGGKVVQITSNQANKYRSIERIRSRIGLEKSEIAVFGDDMNDLEMLAGYPNAVAMGNSCEAVRRLARWITRSNDADGVAYAIERLLKLV